MQQIKHASDFSPTCAKEFFRSKAPSFEVDIIIGKTVIFDRGDQCLISNIE